MLLTQSLQLCVMLSFGFAPFDSAGWAMWLYVRTRSHYDNEMKSRRCPDDVFSKVAKVTAISQQTQDAAEYRDE